tara:strand:- start:211 stop:864 length:654 start_codon:yes stop_codon:yes gene_type:complete
MKITKSQLRRIVKEEKRSLLEYELHVDGDGNVYDDEGNVEKKGSSFGRRYGGETYTGTSPPWTSGRESAAPMQGSVRGKQLAAIEVHLSQKPNKFLQSLADQMKAGRRLSKKQKAVMNKIMIKADPSNVSLFEGKMKITKRQLRRIIKEERDQSMADTPSLTLRNAIMDAYETVYEDEISRGSDPSVAQDRASDRVMMEVEAWLDAVGIPRTYVGLS